MSTNTNVTTDSRSMNGTQTLSRALDILFALAEEKGSLTVSEIAEKVSIPESSIYRFLQTLEQNGIVERRSKGRIGLGMRILDLARSLSQQMHQELIPLALPIMEELTSITNETSLLFVRSGTNAICIQHVKSRALIQYSTENGRILPLHLGASSKAILAFESEKIKKAVIDGLKEEHEKLTLTDDLLNIRERGYALSHGEADSDVFAIGAPVLDSRGSIVASLSIAGPVFRLDQERTARFTDAVVSFAEQLSRRLGSFDE